jgi:4-hydroxy-tetrahydrodipicolinate synthase
MISGSITALATPFTDHGIDDHALADFVDWQIGEGAGALAACTITGEAPTLTPREYRRVIEIVVEAADRRVPVIAGLCFNATARAVEQAGIAERAGADAVLVPTPFYNKPTQEGICRHVEAIAAASGLPILVENARARSNLDIKPETLARLARLDAVLGYVDEAGAPTPFTAALAQDTGLRLFTASDTGAVAFRLAGGSGTLSAIANVTPRLCAEMHRACDAGRWSAAIAIQQKLDPLLHLLDGEGDPAAIKYALFLMRPHFNRTMRLPMLPAGCGTARRVAAALEGLRGEIAFA